MPSTSRLQATTDTPAFVEDQLVMDSHPAPCAARSRDRKSALGDSSPEIELILCCARTRLGAVVSERIRTLVSQDIDWQRLQEVATTHRVMPLLYWNLRTLGNRALPEAVFRRLEDHFFQVAAHNLAVTAELLSLLRVFEAKGIRAVPFKGPVLAGTVYGNLGLREFGDLDILVSKQDICRARDLMLFQGYRLAPDFQRAMAWIHPPAAGIYPFSGPTTAHSRVEIHVELEPWFFRFNTDEMLERAQPSYLAGERIWTLSPEDTLLLLCVHGTKHWWYCLDLIIGVAECIHAATPEWRVVLDRARRRGAARMLLLGLLLARNLVGTGFCREIEAAIQTDAAVESLAARAQHRLFSPPGGAGGVLQIPLMHLQSRERILDRAGYCLGIVLMPELAQGGSMPLPWSLRVVYWALKLMNRAGCCLAALAQRLADSVRKNACA